MHLFLVDRLLEGVLEVDASTIGGDRARSRHSLPDRFVSTVWTEDDERLLHRETPLTRQLGKRSWQFGILSLQETPLVCGTAWYV